MEAIGGGRNHTAEVMREGRVPVGTTSRSVSLTHGIWSKLLTE